MGDMDNRNYMDEYSFANRYLVGDEYILWKGRPERGNIVTSSDKIMIPFSIMWLGFAVFWEMTAITSGAPFFFALWGIPFVGIGIYMFAGRFVYKAYLRDKTFYIVTNKKIIIKQGNKITMKDGRDLPPMDIEIHKNGNGTIYFAAQIGTRKGWHNHVYCILENLVDVAQAQNAISQMER